MHKFVLMNSLKNSLKFNTSTREMCLLPLKIIETVMKNVMEVNGASIANMKFVKVLMLIILY